MMGRHKKVKPDGHGNDDLYHILSKLDMMKNVWSKASSKYEGATTSQIRKWVGKNLSRQATLEWVKSMRDDGLIEMKLINRQYKIVITKKGQAKMYEVKEDLERRKDRIEEELSLIRSVDDR